MSMSIRTNVASLDAQRNLSRTQMEQSKTFQRLSSGYRINSAADDAAGLGISESMKTQIRSYAVAERNANDGVSMAETADSAAAQIQDIFARLRELAIQSSNGSLQASDRTNLNTEFLAMNGEIDRISSSAKFNGINLLSGVSTPVSFQVGIGTTVNDQVSVSFGGVTSAALGLNASVVDTVANSQLAVTAIDSALTALSAIRSGFGASVNRLGIAISNSQSARTNISAANSRIRDVDVAEETAQMARSQVLLQAGAAVLAQANQSPQLALSLLKG